MRPNVCLRRPGAATSALAWCAPVAAPEESGYFRCWNDPTLGCQRCTVGLQRVCVGLPVPFGSRGARTSEVGGEARANPTSAFGRNCESWANGVEPRAAGSSTQRRCADVRQRSRIADHPGQATSIADLDDGVQGRLNLDLQSRRLRLVVLAGAHERRLDGARFDSDYRAAPRCAGVRVAFQVASLVTHGAWPKRFARAAPSAVPSAAGGAQAFGPFAPPPGTPPPPPQPKAPKRRECRLICRAHPQHRYRGAAADAALLGARRARAGAARCRLQAISGDNAPERRPRGMRAPCPRFRLLEYRGMSHFSWDLFASGSALSVSVGCPWISSNGAAGLQVIRPHVGPGRALSDGLAA